MTQKKESGEEEFVFEFYDEDYAKSLEDVEKPEVIEEYNEIDFETDLNEEQLDTYRGLQTVRISQFVGELNPKVYKRSTVRYKLKKDTKNKPVFKSAADL